MSTTDCSSDKAEERSIRAEMRSLLREAAELGRDIQTKPAEFLYEAATSWNVEPFADGFIEPADFAEARERFEIDLQTAADDEASPDDE